MFFQRIQSVYLARFASLFEDPDILHGVSTRKGGESLPPFSGLNLGIPSEDNRETVFQNRHTFFSHIGIPETSIVQAEQVHGDSVRSVKRSGNYPDTDGFITNTTNLMLTIRVADCLPVFLYAPQQKVIGLVHAGWRGSSMKIVQNAVRTMVDEFGVGVDSIHSFLGPSIGPCCYEVGDEVAAEFPESCVQNNHLDLWKTNQEQLVSMGLAPSNIRISEFCTCCHQDWFFSHRGSGGKTGRMLAFIMLR